jgi:serine/threonine-protein kinase
MTYLMENSLMRRSILIAVMLLALGSTLLATLPARAAEYGAIAWDRQTGKRGWSWNQPTQKHADEVAVSECGASGCKVIIRAGSGMCAALASTEDGKFIGAASRKDRDAARVASLKDCDKGKKGECTIRFSDCNK